MDGPPRNLLCACIFGHRIYTRCHIRPAALEYTSVTTSGSTSVTVHNWFEVP
jgi:hypothetical protein